MGQNYHETEREWPLIKAAPLPTGITFEMLRACWWRRVNSDDMWVSPDDVWFYSDELTLEALGLEFQVAH